MTKRPRPRWKIPSQATCSPESTPWSCAQGRRAGPWDGERELLGNPIQTGAAPAYVELADGFVETLHGDRNEARVNIAPADVRWQNPQGK